MQVNVTLFTLFRSSTTLFTRLMVNKIIDAGEIESVLEVINRVFFK